MCTKESPVHENVKKAMVDMDERSTNLIFRTLHNTARVARNSVSDEVVGIEAKGNAKIEDISHLVAGARGRIVFENGDTEHGIWSAGMIMGLINDIPSVEELVTRIVAEAEDLIKGRLAKCVA